MTTSSKRYTVTAALPYANGPVHIGHLAGAYLPADIYARYLRSTNQEVVFICGTDEHGVAITIQAQKESTTPQAIVDHYHKLIHQSFKDFNISFDVFSRTSNETHTKTAQEFFLKFHKDGKFKEIETEQLFDPEAKQFLADRYIVGTCPVCAFEKAYGDQCENCGTSLNPTDLINPKSALSGAIPEFKKTKHWFLPLEDYQKDLEKYILVDHPEWKANVLGQCRSWLINDGLHPRAMTRDLDWGIPVPLADAKGKVLYVWFDAPLGYITATQEWAAQKGEPDSWKKFWLKDHANEDTRLVCFIGKDNIVFHCIIFPAILMGQGEYILPWNVPANEFLNLEGQKISTSRNWAVWLHEFLISFPGKGDILRYALTATLPENKDNDFTWKDFQSRNNNELVAILGNLINRMTVLTHKYQNGLVPEPGTLHVEDEKLLAEISITAKAAGEAIEHFKFREALSIVMDLARTGNKYLADQEPWKKINTVPDRIPAILYTSLQLGAALAPLLEPFMPDTAHKINLQLGCGKHSWEDTLHNPRFLISGHPIAPPVLLFDKIEDDIIQQQIDALKHRKEEIEASNLPALPTFPTKSKPEISFEDFQAIDIRVAQILSAKKIPNSDKLLELKIDTGLDHRTLVSGISQYFSPEEIIGKKVVVLLNLKPRKIKGIMSQGMILMAEGKSGELNFVTADAEPGSTIQ